MPSIKLNSRALDSFYALRVEPFLKLISIYPPRFDPRSKAFHYVFSSSSVISQLMMAGHISLAISLRDHNAKSLEIAYQGNSVSIVVTITMPDGSDCPMSSADVAPGLDVAIVELFMRDISSSILAADRYLNAMSKLVYCAPELLINANRNGLSYRVRTDTPPVDQHLITTLDRAMSLTGVQIVAFRVICSEYHGNKREAIEAAQVVKRTQPLRPLAIQALSRFLQPQSNSGISIR